MWKMGLRDNFFYRKSLKYNSGSLASFGIKIKCYRRERFFIVVLGDFDVEGGGLISCTLKKCILFIEVDYGYLEVVRGRYLK